MAASILTSTKKVLGIVEADESFDVDILMHINSAFSTLNQLGIGPEDGFLIEDKAPTWDDFLGDDKRLNSAKSYVYLRVKLFFDPPNTSFVLQSMEKQIEELGWRLNTVREGDAWTDPFTPVVP